MEIIFRIHVACEFQSVSFSISLSNELFVRGFLLTTFEKLLMTANCEVLQVSFALSREQSFIFFIKLRNGLTRRQRPTEEHMLQL